MTFLMVWSYLPWGRLGDRVMASANKSTHLSTGRVPMKSGVNTPVTVAATSIVSVFFFADLVEAAAANGLRLAPKPLQLP